MTSRIYTVTEQSTGKYRLVQATTKNVALRHVADQLFTAESATQSALVAGLNNGIRIEQTDDIPNSPDAPDAAAEVLNPHAHLTV